MDLFSRCFSGMAGDCKRIKIKVDEENGLGRGLDWEAEMACQLNFQTIASDRF